MRVDKRWIWAVGIFSVLIIADQWVKWYVKTHFQYGEVEILIPGWLNVQFVENPGMAFGWMLPGQMGKLLLTIFRIGVFIGITVYLIKLIQRKSNTALIACMSLILAGALGNILDSVFYGVIFDKGAVYDEHYMDYMPYTELAEPNGVGYAPWLMGNVVDMIHVCKYIHFPEWVPMVGGEVKALFPPIFNIADSAISVGIVLLLLFQKRFFAEKEQAEVSMETPSEVMESEPTSTDVH
jgi:signal peptidase II